MIEGETQMNPFKTLFVVVGVALMLGAGLQVARAQDDKSGCSSFPCTDVYTVDYFANANTAGAPDATVRIINPGTRTSENEGDDMCALIYVFDANQQLSECCGCRVTANALLTLSVNKNLTNNPLLGAKLKTGVIKILSSDDEKVCDPAQTPSSDSDSNGISMLFPTLRAWAVHIQNKVGTVYPITEGESQAAALGQGEYTDLIEDCTVLTELGSGAGICNCPPEPIEPGGTPTKH
jgi:hypothetical protein